MEQVCCPRLNTRFAPRLADISELMVKDLYGSELTSAGQDVWGASGFVDTGRLLRINPPIGEFPLIEDFCGTSNEVRRTDRLSFRAHPLDARPLA